MTPPASCTAHPYAALPRRRDDQQPTRACPPSRTPGPDERTIKPVLTTEEPPTTKLSPPPILFVDQAPTSRPSGRYAVGLRPSLDPDAYLDVCAAIEDSPNLRSPKP